MGCACSESTERSAVQRVAHERDSVNWHKEEGTRVGKQGGPAASSFEVGPGDRSAWGEGSRCELPRLGLRAFLGLTEVRPSGVSIMKRSRVRCLQVQTSIKSV